MIFSYNWLQSFFEEELPKPRDLAEILTNHAFEIETPFRENGDWVMEINVLPDRSEDCLCHLGIAREISAILGYKIKEGNIRPVEDKKLLTKNHVSIEVKDEDSCLRYVGRVMTGIVVGPSPLWIQQRLKVCGISPINNVVDATNYVMLEMGQPLHAFDYEKLSEDKKIIVEKTKKKETFSILGDRDLILDKGILMIRDSNRSLAIAGIKGGKRAEIDENTKAIVLESACFDKKLVYKTSKKIKLRTDSSIRFSYGVDAELGKKAIDRVACLIQETAGATVLGGVVDKYNKKEEASDVRLDFERLHSALGITIPVASIKRIFKSLGFVIKKTNKTHMIVCPPSFRKDIVLEENLIEEVGRIYGYDRIESRLPDYPSVPPVKNNNLFWEGFIKDNLKEMGFVEVYNYSLIGEDEKNLFSLKAPYRVENPLTVNSEYLRTSLTPLLLRNTKNSLKYEDDFKIYEIGKVFLGRGEKRYFSGIITGNDFFLLKGYINSLLEKGGISDVKYVKEVKNKFWHSQKSAGLKIGNKIFGEMGEVSYIVLDKLGIKRSVLGFEIDFDLLQKELNEENEYRMISNHPEAIRDISVLVPNNVLVEDVMGIIEIAGGELVRDVDIFDIYENEGERKSISFHIVFQSQEKTLDNKEINNLQNKIINVLEKNPDWEVRK